MTPRASPHVLIIGAGIGGMTLAQNLRKQGISFEIFERDHDQYARLQGWAMSLHWVLDDLLNTLPDDMPPVESVSHFYPHNYDASMGMWDLATGHKIMGLESTPELKMVRANRSYLRNWLSTNLPTQWGKHFDHYETSEDGKTVTAFFKDGTSATGDILVAADGAQSHVRLQLVGPEKDRLRTIPMGAIVGETTVNRAQREAMFTLGRSAWLGQAPDGVRTFHGLKEISADGESAVYYWILSWRDEAAVSESYWTKTASKQTLHDYALKSMEKYQPRFTEIIRSTKLEDIVFPPMVIRDLVPQETPRGRVVLMGDAAHAMAPHQGEGGNHAMRDAIKLGSLLGSYPVDKYEDAIVEFEKDMVPRAAEAVIRSRNAAISEEMQWNKIRAKQIYGDDDQEQ